MNEKDINPTQIPDEAVESPEDITENTTADLTAPESDIESAESFDTEGNAADPTIEEDESNSHDNAAETGDTADEDADNESAPELSEGETESDESVQKETDSSTAENTYVEEEDEEDIAYVAERITGARHSNVSTAAPVRTRTPEQNRNIGNGIPMRERKTDSADIPAPAAAPHKFLNPFTITVATALIAVILMITSVLIINSMYIENGEKSRPADFDMADKIDPDTIMDIESNS